MWLIFLSKNLKRILDFVKSLSFLNFRSWQPANHPLYIEGPRVFARSRPSPANVLSQPNTAARTMTALLRNNQHPSKLAYLPRLQDCNYRLHRRLHSKKIYHPPQRIFLPASLSLLPLGEGPGMRVPYPAHRPRPSQKPSPPFGRATPLLQNATLLLHFATLCYTLLHFATPLLHLTGRPNPP